MFLLLLLVLPLDPQGVIGGQVGGTLLGQRGGATSTDVKPALPGTIHGKVVAADTGEPVKSVAINFRGMNGQTAATATTDASGMYEILNVDVGMYMGAATKNGYVASNYHSKSDQITPLNLASAQDLKNIDFFMTRTGVISGVVQDEDEEPVPDMTVQVLMKRYTNGVMRINGSRSVPTDDRGQFRVYDLGPGRYYLRVVPRNHPGRPEAHYAPVLYPNAVNLGDAQLIKVTSGQEVAGMKFKLHETKVVSVAGRVTDARSGDPVNGANIQLTPPDVQIGGGGNMNASSRQDGTFRFNDVPPGHYRLVANSQLSGQQVFSSKLVDVPDHNVNDLAIGVSAGAVIKGTVVAEGGSLPERLRIQLTPQSSGFIMRGTQPAISDPNGNFQFADVTQGSYDVSVIAMGMGGMGMGGMGSMSPQQMQQGGFAGRPGMPSQPQAQFFIGNVTVNNLDVTETGFTVGEAATALEMTVRLDFRAASITGRALGTDNNPLPNAKIVLLSSDPKKREGDRYFKRTQSDNQGNFKVSNLIPGDYLMLIWPGDDPGVVQDPEVMAEIDKHCTRVSVGASGSTSLDLKLVPAVQTIASGASN